MVGVIDGVDEAEAWTMPPRLLAVEIVDAGKEVPADGAGEACALISEAVGFIIESPYVQPDVLPELE